MNFLVMFKFSGHIHLVIFNRSSDYSSKKKVRFTNCCGFLEIYKFFVSIELVAYVRCITIQEASVSHFVNASIYHGQFSLQKPTVLTIWYKTSFFISTLQDRPLNSFLTWSYMCCSLKNVPWLVLKKEMRQGSMLTVLQRRMLKWGIFLVAFYK